MKTQYNTAFWQRVMRDYDDATRQYNIRDLDAPFSLCGASDVFREAFTTYNAREYIRTLAQRFLSTYLDTYSEHFTVGSTYLFSSRNFGAFEHRTAVRNAFLAWALDNDPGDRNLDQYLA